MLQPGDVIPIRALLEAIERLTPNLIFIQGHVSYGIKVDGLGYPQLGHPGDIEVELRLGAPFQHLQKEGFTQQRELPSADLELEATES